MEKKRCLVTGGAGFIGSHIVGLLVAQGHSVAVVDDLSSGKRENLPDEATLYEADICYDLESIFEKEHPQIVFHLAAQVSVSVSVREPEVDAQLNILGSISLLEYCRKYKVERVVYSSSGAAYGEPESLPLDEDHSTYGVSPYGISKYMVERYLYYYRYQFGIDFIALRYANVYGPRQDPHGEAGVASIFCEHLLKGKDIVIYGDGRQTRDFVFVEDVASANICAMDAEIDPTIFPAFNVSTQVQTNINTLFDLIAKHAGSTQKPIYADKRPGDVLDSCLANQKIKKHLNWSPQFDPDEGIRRTVEFFKDKINSEE
jgi:UDP-glucose 4-epimerase